MPIFSLLVLIGMVIGTSTFGVLQGKRGVGGRRLFVMTWTFFFGLTLILSMSAHCLEILIHTFQGRTADNGTTWAYNFRVYSLLLLGVVLITQGLRSTQAAARLVRGGHRARADAMRSAWVVLAVAAPLIPIHTFFGPIITGLAGVTLLVLGTVGRRLPEPALAALPDPVTAHETVAAGR